MHKCVGELFQMWIMATPGIGRVCMYSSFSENRISYPCGFSTTRFAFCLVLFRHLCSFSLSMKSFCRFHQEVNHYSSAFCLHGWCNHFFSNGSHSFSMQVRWGTDVQQQPFQKRTVNLAFSTTSFTVFFPLPVELYQEMDHWLYPFCMAGIVFHRFRGSDVQ